MNQEPRQTPSSTWSPYADGTSGHQGDASEAAEPSRRSKIGEAYWQVQMMLYRGTTWKELADVKGWHHGQASSALSNLARSGAIVRLSERRGGSGVYVTPENVQGREVAQRRKRTGPSSAKATRDAVYDWCHASGYNFNHPSIQNLLERLGATDDKQA